MRREIPITPETFEYLSQLNEVFTATKTQLTASITSIARQHGIVDFSLGSILPDKVTLDVPDRPEESK